ncbi:DNA mismatch repair ATPase msh1 [Tulasnella sp. 427]|nr:DNA mismatch repair ATPase msh1 [Tulasnella sp. 427]
MLCRQLSVVNTRRKISNLHSNALHSIHRRRSPQRVPTAKRIGQSLEDALIQDAVVTKTAEENNADAGNTSSPPNTARKTRVKKRFSDLPVSFGGEGGVVAALDPDWRQDAKARTDLAPTLIPSDVKATAAQPSGPNLPKTQLATDIIENLAKFPHCILLTRVGNFYESYFDQATEVAELLTIKLTTRSWGGGRVPMAGFPLAHLDRHLKRLVQGHKRFAAICEEFKRSDGSFERRVVRVVTPGTLIDESFVNPFENNYLMALSPDPGSDDRVEMAWTDVATGEFFTQTVPLSSLPDEVARVRPKEVVLPEALRTATSHPIQKALVEESAAVSYIRAGTTAPKPADYKLPTHETEAIALLTGFMKGSLLEHMPGERELSTLLNSAQETGMGRLQMDSHTIKALEIREELREGGVSGSLMSVVKRTVTSSGTRLLERWLCSPSASISVINARQSVVAVFHRSPHFRSDIVALLKQTEDVTRIVQKFALGKGDADDLREIRDTIRVWDAIYTRIQAERPDPTGTTLSAQTIKDWEVLNAIISDMTGLLSLADQIDAALEDHEPGQAKDSAEVEMLAPGLPLGEALETECTDEQGQLGSLTTRTWTIKPSFSSRLTTLHRKLDKLHRQKGKLEENLREQTGAQSLILNNSNIHGWHVRVPKPKDARTMGDVEHMGLVEVSRSKSSKTFFYSSWTTLGTSIAETEVAILDAERDVFAALRDEIKAVDSVLRKNARVIDELDVATSFASLAVEMNFVRPEINESAVLNIVHGRHPTVEMGLLKSGRNFVPNSVYLHPQGRLHFISGPNMAGKSTLLRQTAVIVLLAQTGSFVPAESATIGIVDKVFARIGAKDDLFRDRSTFMVEMMETADILKKATPRSLVIMDEVGRGTTVKDGVAIAFGTAHYLYDVHQCRSLFATHFHDVADLFGYDDALGRSTEPIYQAVDFFCTDVDETEDGYFTYSHKLQRGLNRDSHGIKVAKMAGMPERAISVAIDIATLYKEREARKQDDGIQLRDIGKLVA